MAKESWVLVEDVGEVPADFAISELEIVSFLQKGEIFILSDEMRKRAKKLGGNLGQRHAEFLLNCQIPEAWRQYYLVFPGTVWRDRDGDLCVPYLSWYGGRWVLGFNWLGYVWGSGGRLLVARNAEILGFP